MKTIGTLKATDFLRACNRVKHAVEHYLEVTGLTDIRKIMPENLPKLPEPPALATAEQRAQFQEELAKAQEERQALMLEQSKKNISAMFDRALDEYPEETYALLCTLVIPDHKTEVRVGADGKEELVELPELEELDGFDLLNALLEVLTTPKLMDFFTKLLRSVLTIMDA